MTRLCEARRKKRLPDFGHRFMDVVNILVGSVGSQEFYLMFWHVLATTSHERNRTDPSLVGLLQACRLKQ